MVERRLVVALGVGIACSSPSIVSTFPNQGSLCFTSTPSGSVKVVVTFPSCFSGGCSVPTAAACSIKERSGVIKVASYGEIRQSDGACSNDCVFFHARCESAPIAAGSYIVTYGEGTTNLTLPATRERRFEGGDTPNPCE